MNINISYQVAKTNQNRMICNVCVVCYVLLALVAKTNQSDVYVCMVCYVPLRSGRQDKPERFAMYKCMRTCLYGCVWFLPVLVAKTNHSGSECTILRVRVCMVAKTNHSGSESTILRVRVCIVAKTNQSGLVYMMYETVAACADNVAPFWATPSRMLMHLAERNK